MCNKFRNIKRQSSRLLLQRAERRRTPGKEVKVSKNSQSAPRVIVIFQSICPHVLPLLSNVDFMASALSPSPADSFVGLLRTSAFNDHNTPSAARTVMCSVMCRSRKKRKKKKNSNGGAARISHVQMCIFSSPLALICTGAGMPTVPYWLPDVTQEDGGGWRKESKKRGRVGVREWWGCEDDTSPAAFSLSCFSFVSDGNKKQQQGSGRE